MVIKNNLVTEDKDLLFNDLMLAKNKDLMYMVYQPQYDLDTKEIVGMESLLRYKSEEYGFIPPDIIVDIFEEKGLISALDLYVVRKVFSEISSLNLKNKRVSINLSGKSLSNPDFIDKVFSYMKKEKINGYNIEFELTETEYLNKDTILLIAENVEKLLDRNINISIDDFGIGSSNLSLLNLTAIDKIKIDKSFLDGNEKSNKILETIFYLANLMNLTTVVEGVENIEQENFLKDFSCNVVQGFLYSIPLPLTDIIKLIDN